MKWRTHEEQPDTEEPQTALLAMPDDEGNQQPILLGMYMRRHGHWITENEGTRAKKPYWWVPEDEVVATIRATTSTTGHSK